MGKFNGRTVAVLRDVTADITGFYGVTFISGVEGGVTITNTYTEDWIDFDDVTIGAGVTINATDVFSGDSENVILGTFNVTGTYYHGYDAKTTVKDGGKVCVEGTTILRYNENSDAGIYIYGDGDDSTVEFDCSYYIGAYSGTFYVENANVECGYFLLKNSYDDDTYADIAMTLDGSTLTVAGTTDGQDSFIIDDQASLTLENNSAIADVRDFNILAGANLELSVDSTSHIEATNMNIADDVPLEAEKNEDGYWDFATVITGLNGSGTESDPFLINNKEELEWFRDDVNSGNNYSGKYVKLAADIDLGNEEWTPIGNATNPFKGTFDGKGYTISNLKITHPGTETVVNNVGLFGKTSGATIKDFTVNNVNVTGSGSVAAVVGNFFTGTISNVNVTGNIQIAGYQYVGGIFGWGYGKVENCDVIGDGVATSLIKKVAKSEIYGSGTNGYVGGVVGWIGEGNSVITGCTVKDITITTNDDTVGGISGIFHYGNTFTDCTLDTVVITAPDNDGYNGIIAGHILTTAGSTNTYSVTVNNVTATADDVALSALGSHYNSSLVTDTSSGNVLSGTVNNKADFAARIGDKYYATVKEALAAAQDGDEVNILVAGNYAVPTGKNITITGAVDGVTFGTIGAINMGGASVTFNNVTFNYDTGSTYKGLQHSGDLVYNNCTFNGQVFLYGASETFNSCTFNQTSADAYNVWTYSADVVNFNSCTFNSAGKSVLIYNEGATEYNKVNVTDCSFIASAPVDGKAAIEMDSSLNAGIELTVTNSTATGFGTGNVSGNSLWNNKKNNNTTANNDITVVVDNETVLEPVTFVAMIGKIGYTSLAEAIAAANGGTVVLLADIELSTMVVIEDTVVLDLNGHTISVADGWSNSGGNDAVLCVAYGGNLTVEDSVGGGTIDSEGTAYAAIKLTYTGDNADNGTAVLTVNGGKLIGTYYAIVGNGGRSNTAITINGGTITATNPVWGYGIFNPQNGTVTVNGGTITADTGIEMRGGTLVVNGGEIISTATEFNTGKSDSGTTVSGAAVAISQHNTNHPISVTVNGGVLKGIYALYQDRLVKNYTPSTNLSAYISANAELYGDVYAAEEGYVVEGTDGSYNLNKYLIKVTYPDGTVEYYNDMREAVPHTSNCPRLEGATITLLGDMSGLGMRFMENGMIFDLNGYTYTLTGGTGSQGTETSGFQVRPEVTETATIKNGTIKLAEGVNICWMFNSYATNFIVEDVVVDCTNLEWGYGASCYAVVSRAGDNVEFAGNTTIVGFNSEVAGPAINVGDTMTIGENVNLNGTTVELDEGATLTAPAGLDVITVDGCNVVYADGVYSSMKIVATVNGVEYYSLAEAFEAAKNGGIVVLVADVKLDASIEIAEDANITLDLNGKTITVAYDESTSKSIYAIYNYGTFTLTDSATGGTIIARGVQNHGTMTMAGGTIVSCDTNGGAAIWNVGTLEMTGGTLKATYQGTSSDSICPGALNNSGTATLTGGTLDSVNLRTYALISTGTLEILGDAVTINSGHGAVAINGGYAYIEGGNFNTKYSIGESDHALYVYAGDVTVEGGTFDGRCYAICVNGSNAAVAIEGGSFTAEYQTVNVSAGELVLNGGTYFDTTGADYVAEGFEFVENEDGYYGIEEKEETLNTRLYYVKGFKPAGSDETRYGFLMTIGIDSLNYKKDGCGFYLTVGGVTKRFIIENGVVWEDLTVELPDRTDYITPEQFGEGNKYIMNHTVYFTENDLATLGDMTVYVQAFVTTFDGVEIKSELFNCGTLVE